LVEACDFMYLVHLIADSKIISVHAEALEKANGLINTVMIQLSFENGSIATISYLSNGNKQVSKEWIEVFCGTTVIQIDDFKSMKIIGKKEKNIKFKTQDKGHSAELKAFHESIIHAKPSIISFEECYLSTLASFKVLQSIRENRKIELS